jgi:hypothetical protein
MHVRCGVIALLADPNPRLQGPRPTSGTADGWRGCTGPASWSPSASRPSKKKPSGTCAGPGLTWSPTAPGPGIGWARACRGGNAWTLTHERWLLQQRFEEPALAATYGHYRAVLAARDAALEAIQADLAGWYDRAPFADAMGRLATYGASPAWAR